MFHKRGTDMHALVFKGIRGFFVALHGHTVWAKIMQDNAISDEDIDLDRLAALDLAWAVLKTGADAVGQSLPQTLEAFGLYLTSHPNTYAVRRLMRFSGADFIEFLYALPDLAPRAAMAVPDLALPRIDVADIPGGVEVAVRDDVPGFEHILAGIIGGMADDYGALIHIEQTICQANPDRPEYSYWSVLVIDEFHTSGRSFSLLKDAV
ncbi:MAG: heme NO-binding domain-containing protein [Planktomarina sp.]